MLLLAALVPRPVSAEAKDCSRLVSLAPALTEMVFALGLGSNLVGRTRYDLYPPEVRNIAAVGGFLDPNIEAIVSLRPSLLVSTQESRLAGERLSALGVPSIYTNLNSVESIISSIEDLGRRCGTKDRAGELARAIRNDLADTKKNLQKFAGRSALVFVGDGSQDPSKLFVSGSDGFYSSLLQALGFKYAFSRATQSLTSISHEGLYALNPDYIFEVVYQEESRAGAAAPIRSGLSAWTDLSAVKKGRVFILSKDYTHIPGPRMNMLAKDMAGLILGAG